MSSTPIRTRIAPSPTGPLHVGTARTALFNYLFARQQGGKFIVRIEDTDLERSDTKYEKDIFEGLAWLGIEADESPEVGGAYGPYRQSERRDWYKKYIARLLDEGKAFYCFHSEEELEKEQEELRAARRPPVHLCEYRTLDPAEAKKLGEIKNSIIRFKTPLGKKIVFKDLIRGEVSFDSNMLGDISIAKNETTPLYNFAVVIDDEEMRVSHVIRGEDHIANTPKQLLFIEALGFNTPHYAHLPLILGADRSKLSKRHGATSVNEYRQKGYLAEALFNFIALLGWNPGGDREIFSKNDLIQSFSLDKVQKSGAIFDIQKLNWMNGEYIRKKSPKELLEFCKPFFDDHPPVTNESLEKIVALEQPRLKTLSEIKEKTDYFFHDPEYEAELLRWKNMTDEQIQSSLETSVALLETHSARTISEIEKIFLEAAASEGDRGVVLWPLRVALSGKKASPGPFEIMAIIGIGASIRRLKNALKKF